MLAFRRWIRFFCRIEEVFGTMTEVYFAVIGDLVGSRTIDPAVRANVQKALKDVLGDLSRQMPAVAVPMRLTAGDEFEGLVRSAPELFPIVRRVSDAIYPVQMAFGVGVGPITTGDFEPDADVAAIDGPCFHNARAALQRAQRRGVWVTVAGFGAVGDGALGVVFDLLGLLRSGWTEKQAAYVAAAREQLQKDVARKFGVSPSVVSESLKSAHFDHVRRAEDTLSMLLGHFGSQAEMEPHSVPEPN